MIGLPIANRGETLRVLCLGAHADDIEIGAGGTILTWIAKGIKLDIDWIVLSADTERVVEAKASAEAFLAGAAASRIRVRQFPDNRFPSHSDAIKDWLLELRENVSPQLVLTHYRGDAHQDHREVSQLTWNLFRDHMILEYEIPKWDGDLGQPNLYIPLPNPILEQKIELLMSHFGTQRSKDWFQPETFRALPKLRGIECRAPDQFAEAFYGRKVLLT